MFIGTTDAKYSSGNGACVEFGAVSVDNEWRILVKDSKQTNLIDARAPFLTFPVNNWDEFVTDVRQRGVLDNVTDHYYSLVLDDGGEFTSVGTEDYTLWHIKGQDTVLVFTPNEIRAFVGYA